MVISIMKIIAMNRVHSKTTRRVRERMKMVHQHTMMMMTMMLSEVTMRKIHKMAKVVVVRVQTLYQKRSDEKNL